MRNNVNDIVWMFGFGLLGYILKRFDYPIAPIILGLILSTLFESNFRRAVMLEGSIPAIFTGILQSPTSIFLFALIIFLMITQTGMYKNWRKKLGAKLEERRGATRPALPGICQRIFFREKCKGQMMLPNLPGLVSKGLV